MQIFFWFTGLTKSGQSGIGFQVFTIAGCKPLQAKVPQDLPAPGLPDEDRSFGLSFHDRMCFQNLEDFRKSTNLSQHVSTHRKEGSRWLWGVLGWETKGWGNNHLFGPWTTLTLLEVSASGNAKSVRFMPILPLPCWGVWSPEKWTPGTSQCSQNLPNNCCN